MQSSTTVHWMKCRKSWNINISSPTFTLIWSHLTKGMCKFHIDVTKYRNISDEKEHRFTAYQGWLDKIFLSTWCTMRVYIGYGVRNLRHVTLFLRYGGMAHAVGFKILDVNYITLLSCDIFEHLGLIIFHGALTDE